MISQMNGSLQMVNGLHREPLNCILEAKMPKLGKDVHDVCFCCLLCTGNWSIRTDLQIFPETQGGRSSPDEPTQDLLKFRQVKI